MNLKPQFHPRNKHNKRYNFEELGLILPELKLYVRPNSHGDLSIDFANSNAVKALNKALLKKYYNIEYWDIPKGYLCAPIPGRADYIHYVADLLAESNNSEIPTGEEIKVLDIGVGANCVYPIIGNGEYGWSFIGSEISEISIASAKTIIEKNSSLKENVTLRLQTNSDYTFRNILNKEEHITIAICNPPFYTSEEDAQKNNTRKVNNLTGKQNKKSSLNFGGQHNELWCEGGELKFIKNMIFHSREFKNNCQWFTSLVSKKDHLRPLKKVLKKAEVSEYKVIPMEQGNKVSRIIAWRF